MTRVTLVGTGLIGSSIGLGLGARGWQVSGWDPHPPTLETAHRIGAIGRTLSSGEHLGENSSPEELIVLAAPPRAIVSTLAVLETPAVVTDVAGIKVPIMTKIPAGLRFIGGHPMAGRESVGPEAASASMFRGASWVLCPTETDQAARELVGKMVSDLGANPIEMEPDTHDRAVAVVSHLPQVLASALIGVASRQPGSLDLAAGGFRDITRVARSEPSWWSELLISNREGILAAISQVESQLEHFREMIDDADSHQIEEVLGQARSVRNSLSAPVAAIGVILEDQPGEMVRVGHALEKSGVDLRDLQLRHATHGGGGVLTLSVRTEEESLLRSALTDQGFRLAS